MKRLLGMLLSTLMIATMAAPLIDIGVAYANLQGWTVGNLTPTTVSAGGSAAIGSFSVDDAVGPPATRYQSVSMTVSPTTSDVALVDSGDGTNGCVAEVGAASPLTATFSNAQVTTSSATPATTYTLTFTVSLFSSLANCQSNTNEGTLDATNSPTLAVTAGDTVTFNANDPNPAGASGTMSNESFTSGVPQALTTNAFADTGYTFSGWNTVAGGGGTAYTDGETITISSGVNLFAQWTLSAGSAVATFNGNSSTSGTMSNEVFAAGVPQAITTNAYVRTGFTFTGWNTNSGGTGTAYAPGAVITLSSSVTLYAQWTTNATGGGGGGPPSTTLLQTSPTSGVTTSVNSGTFTAGPITVSHATGAVSFTVTASSKALSVSPQGAITTSGALLAGSYSISGTDIDLSGDTGVWTYTLTVNNPSVTVTFNANGGTGSMAPQSENTATPLTPNTFTRTTFAFTKWNTAANGSGVSYANGATYSFIAPLTLYAQWTATKHRAVTHRVTFNANGGTGTMAVQSNSVLTLLKANAFARSGYNFKGWNTTSNGSGKSYANGAAYSFAASATLYAQWTKKVTIKVAIKVTFRANGGRGTMADESKTAARSLMLSRFTRSGYNFKDWNTKPDGSGKSYANGATFSFATSTTLYAQWVKKAVVIIPAVPGVVTLSPFMSKSATLTSDLQAQVAALASDIKTNHDTKIALEGFSGEFTTANESNEKVYAASLKLARAQANAVETYLTQQLAAIGVTGCTITTSGSAAPIPASANATPASRAQNRKVVATLS
jgi:uncharacterized repeat protein (TIGR02543 family)